MKRTRLGRRNGLSRRAEQVIRAATGLAASGSRTEDGFWQQQLDEALCTLLAERDEDSLNTVLDHLYTANADAYNVLADSLESCTEQGAQPVVGNLLVAAPVLAWSRFEIPAGKIPPKVLANLRVQLQAHVFAHEVEFVMGDFLFSPDQLPQGYGQTAEWLEAMQHEATAGVWQVEPAELGETVRFLADLRYVLIAVRTRPGAPVFRWQEADGNREQAAEQWRVQGGNCLQPLLAGCAIEAVLPDAYFAACRQGDRLSRPYSIQASAAFLSTTLDLVPDELHALVAPFHDQNLEEYRVSFTVGAQGPVVHGVVWPLLGQEDENADVLAQIDSALKSAGLSHIVHQDTRYPLEYCDDCGAPLYPTREGEAVHAELPEDKAEQMPRHLH